MECYYGSFFTPRDNFKREKLSREEYYDECFLSKNFKLTCCDFFKPTANMSQWIEKINDIMVNHQGKEDRLEGIGATYPKQIWKVEVTYLMTVIIYLLLSIIQDSFMITLPTCCMLRCTLLLTIIIGYWITFFSRQPGRLHHFPIMQSTITFCLVILNYISGNLRLPNKQTSKV